MMFAYIVNDDLKMDKGKIAAQVSHGAIGLMQLSESEYPSLKTWRQDASSSGSKAVVCKADAETLARLRDEADWENLPTYQVVDAGQTQVAAGSETVLAIGPASPKRLEPLIKSLKLL